MDFSGCIVWYGNRNESALYAEGIATNMTDKIKNAYQASRNIYDNALTQKNLFKLEKISVNGKDANGCLKHFTDASIDFIKVTVRGIGRKDLKITGMSLYDGRHRHLNLPENQTRTFQVVYKCI